MIGFLNAAQLRTAANAWDTDVETVDDDLDGVFENVPDYEYMKYDDGCDRVVVMSGDRGYAK